MIPSVAEKSVRSKIAEDNFSSKVYEDKAERILF